MLLVVEASAIQSSERRCSPVMLTKKVYKLDEVTAGPDEDVLVDQRFCERLEAVACLC